VEGVPAVEDDQLLVLLEFAQANAALGAVMALLNQNLVLDVRRNGRTADVAASSVRLAFFVVPNPREPLYRGRRRSSATRRELELLLDCNGPKQLVALNHEPQLSFQPRSPPPHPADQHTYQLQSTPQRNDRHRKKLFTFHSLTTIASTTHEDEACMHARTTPIELKTMSCTFCSAMAIIHILPRMNAVKQYMTAALLLLASLSGSALAGITTNAPRYCPPL
jgi:hypothetical protein